MTASASTIRPQRHVEGVLIEGYASRFGEVDASGDSVRAGAFARCLRSAPQIEMLWQHRPYCRIGRWTRVQEDGQGLFVRGWVDSPSAWPALQAGLDGLSIGFRPRIWRMLGDRGRQLADIDLIEISLVSRPMLTSARFTIV